MQRSRAYRRDRQRARKKQVQNRIKYWHWDESLVNDVSFIGKLASHRGICSCPVCKSEPFDKHPQKIKADIDFKDQLEELNVPINGCIV